MVELKRKVRVICTDPDATDYSSGEDESEKRARKRIVREISLPYPAKIFPASAESCCQESSNGGIKEGETVKKRTCKSELKGVRQRKRAAEIRDPLKNGCRIWLAPEEASKVYEAKLVEFDTMVMAHSGVASASDGSSVVSRTSSSSVLDLEASASDIGSNAKEAIEAAEEGPLFDLGLPEDPLALPEDLKFDSLFFTDGFLLDDFCSIDDLGVKEESPSELPDFHLELANHDFDCWMNGPLNIACP